MRILVLTPTFLPAIGGAELVILQVYRRLADRHPVRVLTPYLSDTLIEQIGSIEYDHLINFSVRHYHDRYTFMKIRGHRATLGLLPPFSLSAIKALKQEIRIFRPDVINVHYVMPTGLSGLLAQKIKGIPVVITYNGRDVPGPGVPRLWKYWHRIIGRNCADMTFVSKYCREIIYGSGFTAGNIIYNGVEDPVATSSAHVSKLVQKLNLAKNERVLFALQRLDRLKRIDILIQSMTKILEHCPNTRLIIAGKGPDLPRLNKIVCKLGIGERIYFAGFVSNEDLPAYFALADLFVFHSTYETFGIVLAEAMSYSKAIVSVNSTAINEIVDNNYNGILVPPLDVVSFSNAVLELLTDNERRHRYGKNGLLKAQRLFRWDRIALSYEKVLQTVAGSLK